MKNNTSFIYMVVKDKWGSHLQIGFLVKRLFNYFAICM